MNRPLDDISRRALGLLGLGARAGVLVLGTAQVREAARHGRLRLAIVAADASDNARDKLLPLLDARKISYHVRFDRVALGVATGKAPLSAIGVSDGALAERIGSVLQEGPATEPANEEG